tara:strand:+ start:180 stop:1664 length:1485 start_codon:yes stop_codon:yes gene_type:complete
MNSKKFIISIDQGTTSTRAILYNQKLIPIYKYQIKIKQYYPKIDWVEQDPNEIWKSVLLTIKFIIKKNKINSNDILSIGITNQRETTILWDKKTGSPVYNAIVWQDKRTAEYCEKLKTNENIKLIKKITGLTIDSYFSATKIKWIIDNIKRSKFLLKQNRLAFGTVDSWILWKLTNGNSHFTDVTNASRTMLFDIKKMNWSIKLLKLFEIPYEILPKVKENVYKFGITNKFGSKISINGMAGDQQSSLIGQACLKKGMSKSTYGTGCFFLMNVGNRIIYSKNNLLTSIAYTINGKTCYCLEGSIFVAGSAIEWLIDKLEIVSTNKEIEIMSKKAKKDSKIYFVPAFNGLGAPYWNQDARGAIYGINRNTNKFDILNATIESIGFQTKDLLNLMEKDAKNKIKQIRVDGGIANNKTFLQFLSNILNINILKSKYSESTALGAAYLSAIGCGIIDINEIDNYWKKENTFRSKINALQRKKIYAGWLNAIDKTLYKL